MAQKKGLTELADQFEGEVSEDRAMLDIKRGIRDNLRHECVGYGATAKPKRVSMLDPLTGAGVAAIDRVRRLFGKVDGPIARGEGTVTPHVGNVDTIQIPIRQSGYNSKVLMPTDMVRLKNEASYRALLVGSMTETLAAAFDAELFEMIIAAAAGQKGATFELKVPKIYNPQKDIDLYLAIADIATELEKEVNAYYIGTPRSDIAMIMDPYFYTRLIKSLGGFFLAIEKALDFIQNEKIAASKVSGVTIVRHIFLDNVIPKEASNDIGFYNFTGYRALIFSRAAAFLVPVLQDTTSGFNPGTLNFRIGQKVMYGKGIIYGDLIRVIKEPSTKENPLPLEKRFVEYRNTYNSIRTH